MGYSIFSETMADMTYQQIEKGAQQKLPVLFPIAVIEEHGPHMCLGTDTYLTYNFCKMLKKALSDMGIDLLIAPPYYWGINVATNGFAGTFTVKHSTMVAVLYDLLECLKSWGFQDIFLFNFHGDFKHSAAIKEVAQKAHEKLGTGVHFIVPDYILRWIGASGEEPYIIVQPTELKRPSGYIDIHAGGLETSLMVNNFPALVDVDLARSLSSSLTIFEGLKVWQYGGEKARKVTPLGYCGNPSEIDLKAAQAYEAGMTEVVSRLILDSLKAKPQ